MAGSRTGAGRARKAASTRQGARRPGAQARTRARGLALEGATVVYVHGIGRQLPANVLKRQWDEALFGRDMGDRTRMAYWADILHPEVLRSDEVEGPAMPGEPDLLGGPAAKGTARARHEARDGERERFAAAMTAEFRAGETAAGTAGQAAPARARRPGTPRAAGYREQILPAPLRGAFTRWVTRLFIRDTYEYFYDPQKQRAIRDRLGGTLGSLPGPVIVVAHSQGAIIAYDVLHELGRTSPARGWITLGAPLGIAEVQDHIRRPLAVPPGIVAWRNFADPADIVALDRTLGDEFRPKGFVQDLRVDNSAWQLPHGYNPHAATGYLRAIEVRETLRAWMGPAAAHAVGPAVIARDLAAELAGPERRIKVLIELVQPDLMAAAGAGLQLVEEFTLAEKAARLTAELEQLTGGGEAARIDPLRHFVAADLTAGEINRLAVRHQQLHIHRIWRNTRKRALITTSAARLQVDAARRTYQATGRGIDWAVLDTGIRPDHPHFEKHANIVVHWDCTQQGKPVKDKGLDDDGHGTHVAGIIAGEWTPPGSDVVYCGMAPEARLHAYKVLRGGEGDDSWIIKALDHVAQVNESAGRLVIHGVNLSLGGPFDAENYACGHSPLCKELRRLWQQGVLVCVAAGNEGLLTVPTAGGNVDINLDLSIGDPANLEECIAVGSVHRDEPQRFGISYFSSRGPTADGRPKPDVVAPGEKIISCNAYFDATGRQKEPYLEMSGTSMACPHVSGLLAAFLSVRGDYQRRPEEVKRLLLAQCTDLKRDRYHQGAGMPNLVKMLVAT
jgi:subtilisin family serine protease